MENTIYKASLLTSAVFTAAQVEKTFQIISLIITIISALVGITFRIVQWVKESKKDGHISASEVEKLLGDVHEELNGVKEVITKERCEVCGTELQDGLCPKCDDVEFLGRK